MTGTQLAGLTAMVGSLAYAVGDMLMLAPRVGRREARVNPFDFSSLPGLTRRAELFATLVGMPSSRLELGAMLGVFATPLVLAGIWLVHQALVPAGAGVAWGVSGLLTVASVIGCFVHGAFLPVAEYAKLIEATSPGHRQMVIDRMLRQLRLLKIAYGVVFLAAIAGTVAYSVAVASGGTLLPKWMAAVNPVTLTIAWVAPQKLMPDAVVRYTEGAGFNLAYFGYFSAITALLW